jgi:hypothetical protein
MMTVAFWVYTALATGTLIYALRTMRVNAKYTAAAAREALERRHRAERVELHELRHRHEMYALDTVAHGRWKPARSITGSDSITHSVPQGWFATTTCGLEIRPVDFATEDAVRRYFYDTITTPTTCMACIASEV